MQHYPVMVDEVLTALAPQAGELYVDATFGAGGYTRAILSHQPRQVIAFDRDPNVSCEDLPITLIRDRFSQLAHYVTEPIDGIVYDLGMSMMQIRQAERGFSFQQDGPLDMRMSQTGRSAADVVNQCSQAELTEIIDVYGEDPRAHKLARVIVGNRPFYRTKDLADCIARHCPSSRRIHAATLTFQALRIYVNEELKELEESLHAAHALLKPGGRMVIVTFHALEERVVKYCMKQWGYKPPKPITPSRREIRENPPSRSAKLRCIVKSS